MDIDHSFDGRPAGVRFDKVRHEPKIRSLTVARTEPVTPAMLRVILRGDDLYDFQSTGFDDHIKVLVPTERGCEARNYTPRRFNSAAGELAIDFALHEAGPATQWAAAAKPGDHIEITGPKKSSVAPAQLRRWLLIGDETALPAIGRCIEDAGSDAEVTSLVAVTGLAEEQRFETRARLTSLWAHRPLTEADQPDALISALNDIEVAPDTFVWVAAEARVVRNLRSYLADLHQQPLGWMKVGGYWMRGVADAHERIG